MEVEEFRQVLQEGEGQFVEFKERFEKSLAKEIVAFANASGGRIFLGVSDDNSISGVNVTNRLKSQILSLAASCDPGVRVELEQLDNVLVINVAEGSNKPYQCSGGFYLRLGPNSQKLGRNEILNFSIRENQIRFDEQICDNFDFRDFDEDKFETFLKLARISPILNAQEILKNLKVLTDEGMTNAGVLFFAKEPYKYIGTSKIRCVLFKGNERLEILDKKEVDKGIIGNIEFAITYLKEHVPVRYEIKGSKRREYPQFSEEAYREAIVNSVAHRDYFQNGEVAVEKLQDIININNPGGLIPSFPKEDFGTLSWPRNRLIADLLSKTYLMEKVGTGVRRIKEACKEGNNISEFKDRGTHFFVTFKTALGYEETGEMLPEKIILETTQNTAQKPVQKSPQKTNLKVAPKNARKILNIIQENPYTTRKEMAEVIGISEDGVKYHLSNMKEKGLLKRVGPDKGGHWEVIGENGLANYLEKDLVNYLERDLVNYPERDLVNYPERDLVNYPEKDLPNYPKKDLPNYPEKDLINSPENHLINCPEKDLKKSKPFTGNQVRILSEIKKNPSITQKELSEIIGITEKNIRNNITKLKKQGLLRRIGPNKGGYWEAVE